MNVLETHDSMQTYINKLSLSGVSQVEGHIWHRIPPWSTLQYDEAGAVAALQGTYWRIRLLMSVQEAVPVFVAGVYTRVSCLVMVAFGPRFAFASAAVSICSALATCVNDATLWYSWIPTVL